PASGVAPDRHRQREWSGQACASPLSRERSSRRKDNIRFKVSLCDTGRPRQTGVGMRNRETDRISWSRKRKRRGVRQYIRKTSRRARETIGVMADRSENGLGRRITRFARVSGGLAGVAARGAARSLGGGKTFSAANATDLTRVLGNLRGPVMKVAQFVATVPGILPPDVAAPLLTLQASAPPMGAGFVRRRMAAELGEDWEKKFKSFDMTAAGAASLGQVHRAVAKDGNPLACKLQYPAMDAAVDSDVRQLKGALRLQRGFDGTID